MLFTVCKIYLNKLFLKMRTTRATVKEMFMKAGMLQKDLTKVHLCWLGRTQAEGRRRNSEWEQRMGGPCGCLEDSRGLPCSLQGIVVFNMVGKVHPDTL